MVRPDDGTPQEGLIGVVEWARSFLAFGYGDIARVLRVDSATLYRWRTGTTSFSPGARLSLSALAEFLREMARLDLSAEARTAWLDRPIARLLGTTPRELLLSGRVDLLTGYLVGLTDAPSRPLPAPAEVRE